MTTSEESKPLDANKLIGLPRDDLIRLITTYVNEIQELNVRIGDMVKKRRRDRIIGIVAIVALAIDLVVTPIIGIVSFTAFSASNNANDALIAQHTALVSTCQANNSRRIESANLWYHSVEAISPKNPNPSEAAAIAKERALIKKTYSPTDCSAIK